MSQPSELASIVLGHILDIANARCTLDDAAIVAERDPVLRDLLGCRLGVGGVGVGHRLHDDGVAAPDGDVADSDRDGVASLRCQHLGRAW